MVHSKHNCKAKTYEYCLEWMERKITEGDDIFTRHYMVSVSGEVLGQIDEPSGGRMCYVCEYYHHNDNPGWVSLDLAKTSMEMTHKRVQAERLKRGKR